MGTSSQTSQQGSATFQNPFSKKAMRALQPFMASNIGQLGTINAQMNPELALQALQSGQLGTMFQGLTDSPEMRNTLSNLIASNAANTQLGGTSTNLMQGYLGGQQVVPPAWQDLINQMYQSQQDLGEQNMLRMAREAAGRQGFSVMDSPVGGEYLRNLTNLEGMLGSERARSTLGMGQQLYQNAAGYNEFQNQLRQAADRNRMILGQASPGGSNQLTSAPSIGQMGTTTRTDNPSLMSNIGQGMGLASQFGSFLQPMSAIGMGGGGGAGAGMGSGAAANAGFWDALPAGLML